MRRLLMVLATALCLVLAAALPVTAVVVFAWTLFVSPMAVPQGQATTFSLTATNQDTQSQLGCLQVVLPTSFVIVSIGNPTANNGLAWASAIISGNTVEVKSATGPGRLESGESVSFTITARATAAGTFAWNNHAFASNICNGTLLSGTPVSITVVPAPTPNPTPTPPPTPAPTSTPPGATPPGATPTAGSTGSPASSPTSASSGSAPPGGQSPTPRPGEPSSTPDSSGSSIPSPTAPASSGGTGTGGADELLVAPLGDSADGAVDDLGTGMDVLALLDGPFVWFVPGAAVGVPGLLVLAWVALQAIGAMAWIPAVRRMGGDDRTRRRSRPA